MASGRVLTLRAHGASYQLYDSPGLGSGKAPGKITRCMERGKAYEQVLLEHIYAQQYSGLAVDVGANVGNHTMWMAAICSLRVVAFEPIVYEELSRNVNLNDLSERVSVRPYALGDYAGTANHVGKGQLSEDGGDIRVRLLDQFKLKDVAVIKIDVEGWEPLVLRGGEETIRRDRPVIFAEEWDTDPEWHRNIAAVLEPWGYVQTKVFKGRESPTPVGKWISSE